VNATVVLTREALFAAQLPALPGADRSGQVRSAYRGLATPHFRTNIVVVPGEQVSTPRASEVDHVVMVLEGCITVSVDGTEYDVDTWAQILVPAHVEWSYRNPRPGRAVFVSVVSDPV
jgi:mannose-6-phosphate isomerase-like protein (cupin superfamily)